MKSNVYCSCDVLVNRIKVYSTEVTGSTQHCRCAFVECAVADRQQALGVQYERLTIERARYETLHRASDVERFFAISKVTKI
jgi:hypothetical protein